MRFSRITSCVLIQVMGLGLGATCALAQTGGGYDLTWNSLDCGSVTATQGGNYTLGGTVGQADAGNLAGGSYRLQGGFRRSSLTTTDAPPDVAEGTGPLVFRLHPNAPNPFATNTALAFSLDRESQVELRIYDLAGRLVRNVLAQHLGPGRHQATWDGRDDSGRRAAHGIYMLQLRAGDHQSRRKIALVP